MSGLGAMMAGGNPDAARGREENDFYPTPIEVTRALLRENPWIANETLWEPCAGDGAMLDVLKGVCTKPIAASDLHPQRSDITSQDFFSFTAPPPGVTMLVTNPPFGTMPAKMIDHAFDIGVQRMALVLKSTYWHAVTRQPLYKRHRPSVIMPLTWRPDFKSLGRPTMEVMWCVWHSPHSPFEPFYRPINKD